MAPHPGPGSKNLYKEKKEHYSLPVCIGAHFSAAKSAPPRFKKG
jgi:hypothetical protein